MVECSDPVRSNALNCIFHCQQSSHNHPLFVSNECKNGATYNTAVEWLLLCCRHRLDRHGGPDCGATSQPFNQGSPTFILVFDKEILQYFVDNPQANSAQALSTAQASPETETVFARISTFVLHFPTLQFSGREEEIGRAHV